MNRQSLPVFVILLLFLSFCRLPYIEAQMDPSSNAFAEAVDSLFADRNDMEVPGGAVIIMKGDNMVLSKCYGAANLAFDVAFDEYTNFPLEGFTEQLVVFSIFQLEKKGDLNLYDSVSKYLPELGFSDRITLSHMINHTSDFPMISSLRLMAGWEFSDPFTHEDFIGLAKKVSADLVEDRDFNHNHGGIKFLMMVVEKVSGVPFSAYAKTNIFTPLNMNSTFIKGARHLDDENSAVAYTSSDKVYSKADPIVFEVSCPK